VHILCFINLLILCPEVEVIKRLLRPLKESAALFKIGLKPAKKLAKNSLYLTSLIAPTILELEKSL